MSGVPGCSWWRSPMTAVVHHSDGYVPKFSRRSPDNSHGSDGVHLGVRALAIHVPSPLLLATIWCGPALRILLLPQCGFSLFFPRPRAWQSPTVSCSVPSHPPATMVAARALEMRVPSDRRSRPWSLLARSKCACPAVDARDHPPSRDERCDGHRRASPSAAPPAAAAPTTPPPWTALLASRPPRRLASRLAVAGWGFPPTATTAAVAHSPTSPSSRRAATAGAPARARRPGYHPRGGPPRGVVGRGAPPRPPWATRAQ